MHFVDILHLIYIRCVLVLNQWWSRAAAYFALASVSQKELDAYYASYTSLWGDKESGLKHQEVSIVEQESHVVDYYNVLKYLCALGNVKKMYIPPLLDLSQGVFQNQLLFEIKMMRELGLRTDGTDKLKRILDLGSGQGAVAMHVASRTGGFVDGLQVDPSQVENAKRAAEAAGLSHRVHFTQGSFNSKKLPFDDETFDAVYDIQAFTYCRDKEHLFREVRRVLKPSGRFTLLEWVLLDKYDNANSEHVEILASTMPVIGAVTNPSHQDYKSALKSASFEISYQGDVSIDSNQAPLIELERSTFAWIGTFARVFLPKRIQSMLERLNRNVDRFIEGTQDGLFTTCYFIASQKK